MLQNSRDAMQAHSARRRLTTNRLNALRIRATRQRLARTSRTYGADFETPA